MKYVDFESDPPEIWGLYRSFVGRLAFDVGANGGMVAEMLAERFDTVVAFEPAVESFERLVETARPNVVAHNVAVSDHMGTVTLVESVEAMKMGELVTGSNLAVSWGPATGVREVPCWTLDHAAEIHGMPDLVKIDTEGHEVEVIAGAKTLLESHPTLLVEIHAAENFPTIVALCPPYHWRKVEHPGYRLDDPQRHEHFFVLGS